MLRGKSVASALILSVLVFGAVGCGDQSVTPGFGTLAVTGIAPSPIPAMIPTTVTITGGDFTNAVGLDVTVTYTATVGTPFLGGTSATQTVPGTITSATTVTSTSPPVVICGPTTLTASVTVTMPSGVWGMSTTPIASFVAPTVTTFAGGGSFPAAIPQPFVLNGTNIGLIGSPCTIHWRSTGGGPPAIFNNGGSTTTTTTGTVASSITITGVSPEATVCGPAFEPAEVFRVDFADGSCTPTVGPFPPAQFNAPTITSIVNAGPTGLAGLNDFHAAIPETFTITGLGLPTTGYGPTGGTAQVTFTALAGTPFNGGTSATVTVPATIVSDTTVSGVSPPALVCGVASITANVLVTVPNGSCTPVPATADFLAPTFAFITNISPVGPWAGTTAPAFFGAAVPEPYQITGAGFGPVGGTAFVRWQNNAGGFTTPYLGGTSNTIVVPAQIISDTVMEGISPEGAFCSPGTFNAGQSLLMTMPDGACSLDSGFAALMNPPTVTAVNDPYEGTNPSTYIVTGQDYGPVGGAAWVTFTSTSAAPNDTPFGGSATVTVPGVITSRTTIEGTTPDATIDVVFDAGAGNNCETSAAVADVNILLEGGACNTPAVVPVTATFNGPAMTDVNGAAAPPPAPVPSTILLNEAVPGIFTVNGTGFGPPNSLCLVTFEDTLAGGFFDGGADSATVPATVISTTQVAGTLPTITAPRLLDNLSVRVIVLFFNGSRTYCNNSCELVAPPTITSITTPRAPFQQGAPGSDILNTWLACMACDTTITGSGFQPAITELFYETALGDAFPIGAGVLGTIPEPTATAPGLGTLRTETFGAGATDTINGASPTDATLDESTETTCRVVNTDNQYHDFGGLTWETTGVLPNVNAGPLGGNNAEMQISVNPNDSLNACICAHVGNGFTQMYHSYTLDGGNTWVQGAVGPPGSLSDDGFGAGAIRFDPMGIFDAFGNYYCVYGVSDPASGNTIVLWSRSADGGATFLDNGAFPFPLSPGLDRWTIDAGPRAGTTPGSPNEAIWCSCVDFATGDILAGLIHTAPGPGPGGAVTVAGSIPVNDFPVGPGDFYQHGTPSLGPNGEVYVSFIQGFAPFGFGTLPPTFVWMSQITLPGGGNGADILVATTNNAAARATITPMIARGKGVIPMHKVIRAGPNAGRVVIVWSDVNLASPVVPPSYDLTVVSQYSDDDAATWSGPQPVHGLDFGHQFFPWMGTDPVRGDLYVGFYDTRNDAANNRAVQWYLAASEDGATWTSQLLAAQAPSDAGAVGGLNDMLEYNGVTVVDGCVYTCWADNSNFTGDNPDGALTPDGFDVLTSVLMLDPDDN